MLENWLDNSCKRYVSLLLPFLKLENGLLRIFGERDTNVISSESRDFLSMNAVFTHRYEWISSKAILIQMFGMSGWMGAPSELSPWFGVHG